MTDDDQLLRRYARDRCESAFGELVKRYLDLVYSAALRIVNGDTHMAEDVAQTVFIDLAQKAMTLPTGVVLAGWLHQHTCYKAATAVRTERRRKNREQIAMEIRTLEESGNPPWEAIASHLDEGLNQLSPFDRDALVLRFLKGQDFRAVGQALGISDDAAQKRVSRAVERLREIFARRGITVGASGLVALVSSHAVQAAPAGLAATISATATITGGALGASTAMVKSIAMTTAQKAIAGTVLVAVIGGAMYETSQASRLREEIRTLPSERQVQQLNRERDDLASQLTVLRGEKARLTQQAGDLLKLRNEAGRLRGEIREFARARSDDAGKSTGTMEMAMKSWLARLNELRRRSKEMAGGTIPEMKYLADKDWLDAAHDEFSTEEGYRTALAGLRIEAAARFLVQAVKGAF